MKKKFIAAILAAALALGTLTACGGSDGSAASTDGGAASADSGAEEPETGSTADGASEEAAPAEGDGASEEADPAEGDEAPEGNADADAPDEAAAQTESKGTITIAASATPHAEILEEAKPLMAAKGWDLEITVFNDYVQPNQVVESGEFDANYFQHISYLDSFNEEQGTHLVNAGGIHYEPFGIYPGTKSDLAALEKGDVIAVPNDTTNEARALLLLQDNGVITLKDGVSLEATVRDIVDNPNEIEIQELEAAQVPRVKDEVAFVILNGNYAMEAGFSVAKDAVVYEQLDSEAAQAYVNVIAVKEGNENNEAIKDLVEVLKSDEITEYINNTYDGGVIPFK